MAVTAKERQYLWTNSQFQERDLVTINSSFYRVVPSATIWLEATLTYAWMVWRATFVNGIPKILCSLLVMSRQSHDNILFPRQNFATVPQGQVQLFDGSFMPRDEWL